MKLLILTQKIDKNDDILGFFHRWVEEFARHCESVIVICLQKGEYYLPRNVKVLSLGKERGVSKIKYLLNFYKYIWQERKNYDYVFVHMNQEYVLLGGLFWKILRKKIFLWRNHKKGNIFTRIAVILSNSVFCTSEFSFTARFKKTKIIPVGIDIEKFRRDESMVKIKNSILSLGRISPVKNIDILIKALQLLDKKGIDFIANIYGDALGRDKNYYDKIRKSAERLEKKSKIIFHKAVPNYKTPEIYNQNEIFVNLTPSGSFDKTIFEAMACEVPVIVSNKSFESVMPKQFLFEEKNAQDLAEKLEFVINLSIAGKNNCGKQFSRFVIKNHDLNKLVKDLIYAFKKY